MSTTATTPVPAITPDERKAKLDGLVIDWTRGGWNVESRTDYQAVISKGHRPNHILHLILTLLTAGLWGLFVWLPLCVFGGVKRKTLAVDEFGRGSSR